MKIKLTIVLLLTMGVINTIKVLQANVQHWPRKKISFYNNIRTENPDILLILLLNEHGLRNNGQIKISGYKTEWKISTTKSEMEQQ